MCGGRPFLAAALELDWLELHVTPAEAASALPVNGSKSCIDLLSSDEWSAAAGEPAALLEVAMRLPLPLSPVARAYAPLTMREVTDHGGTDLGQGPVGDSPSDDSAGARGLVWTVLVLALSSLGLCGLRLGRGGQRPSGLDPRTNPEVRSHGGTAMRGGPCSPRHVPPPQ